MDGHCPETVGKAIESRLLFLAISRSCLLPQAQFGGVQAGDWQDGGEQGMDQDVTVDTINMRKVPISFT